MTLLIWKNEAKEKYCNFATFNKIVDTKTNIIQTETNIQKVGKKMNQTDNEFLISQDTLTDIKESKGKHNLHYG